MKGACKIMNLTYFRPKMRGKVENKNNNPVSIRFVDKTSNIRNVSENIISDVTLTVANAETFHGGFHSVA